MKPEELVIDKLYNLFCRNNYITEDDVVNACDEYDISFFRTDYITEQIISKGVLILDSEPAKNLVVESISTEKVNIISETEDAEQNEAQDKCVLSYFLENYPGMKAIVTETQLFSQKITPSLSELILQAQNNNRYARDVLIQKYYKSALKLCYNYKDRTNISLEDLFPVAVQGIIEAIPRYRKSEHGYFATYIFMWMRQKIDRYICDNQAIIRVPIHVHEKYGYYTARNYDYTLYDIDELEVELSDCFKDESDLAECIRLIRLQNPDSLNLLLENDFDFESDLSVYEISEKNDFKRIIYDEVQKFSDNERMVFFCRYGFCGFEQHTLEETGKLLGVTRERIRQIEVKVIRKLSSSAFKSKLKS